MLKKIESNKHVLAHVLEFACEGLILRVLDELDSLVDAEISRENPRRLNRLVQNADRAKADLTAGVPLPTVQTGETRPGVIISTDQPGAPHGHMFQPDLPIIFGSRIIVKTWDYVARNIKHSREARTVIHTIRSVPQNLANMAIIAHNAQLANNLTKNH